MLRVVLDTNVLVSALVFGGVPRDVYHLAVTEQWLAVTSPALLVELQGVLLTKFRYPLDLVERITSEYKTLSLLVEPTVTVSAISEDPDDDRVLECAVSGRAEAVISGDRHLLALGSFRGIPILTPQAALARWTPKRR